MKRKRAGIRCLGLLLALVLAAGLLPLGGGTAWAEDPGLNYFISLNFDSSMGTASLSTVFTFAGDTVSVAAEPGQGYVLKSIRVFRAGTDVLLFDITDSGQFTMPAEDVMVDVEFDWPSVTYYPVWVGETRVTSANMTDVLGDGTVSYTPGEGSGTLTVTGSPAVTGLHEGAMIWAEGIGLTIEASGGLSLSNDAAAYAVQVTGDLSITGDYTGGGLCSTGGSVTVDGNAAVAGKAAGVFASGDVKITGETVTVSASDAAGVGVVSENGSVVVTGGTWTLDGPAQAVRAKNDISIPGTHEVSDPDDADVIQVDGFWTVTVEGAPAGHVVISPIPPVTFTVTFDANGGSPASQTLQTGEDGILNGDQLSELNATVEREGYKLLGWSLSQGGSVQDLSAYAFSADQTVYAVWELRTFKVVFKANGGSETPSQTVQYGKTASEPDDPVKAGSSFDGWCTDSALTKPYDFSTPVKADLTLYAKWIQTVKYTVVSGGGTIYGKNSGRTVVIVVKRTPKDAECFKHFTSVCIDGATLTPGTDYNAKSGSTVITLEPAYLKTLHTGSHIVTIKFDDGKATTGLTVKAGTGGGRRGARGRTTPSTGDSGDLMLWTGLLLGSGVGLAALGYTRRRLRRSGRL